MGKLDNVWTIGKFRNIVRGGKWEKLEKMEKIKLVNVLSFVHSCIICNL